MAGKRTLTVEILGNARGVAGAVAQADNELGGFASRLDDVGARMRNLGQTMSLGITLPIIGALGLGTRWAGELEDAQAMSAQVFGAMSAQMDAWADNAAKNFGLSKGDAIEWSNQMGIRLRQIGGLAESEAALVSASLVQLAGDFASAFGGSVDEAAQAIGSALTGEFEPLKRYGIVINDAALKNKLFQMTGKEVEGTLTAQQKQTATLALIQEQASIVQGDYARNAEGATNSQRTATAALKDAATTLGTMLLPYVTQAVQFVTDLIDRFQGLDPTMQKIVLVGGLVAAALGPLLFIAGGLATGIAAIASPVGLVIAGVAALAAALIVFYRNNEPFREWVDRVARLIGDRLAVAFREIVGGVRAFASAWSANDNDVTSSGFAGFMERLANMLRDISDVVLPALADAFGFFARNILPTLEIQARYVGTAFSWLAENVFPVVAAVVVQTVQAMRLLVNGVRSAWDAIDGVVIGAVTAIRLSIENFLTVAAPIWEAGLGVLRAVAEGVWNSIRTIVDTVLGVVRGVVQTVTSLIQGDWAGAMQGIRSVTDAVWNGIRGTVSALLDTIRGVIGAAATFIRDVFGGAWNSLVGTVSAAVLAVVGWVLGLRDRIVSAFSGAVSWLIDAGGDVISGLRSGMSFTWGAVTSWFSGRIDAIRGSFAGAGSWLLDAGRAIMDGLLRGLTEAWNRVAGWVGGVAGRIRELKGPLDYDAKLLIPAGQKIMQGLGVGLRDGFTDVSRTVGAMAPAIAAPFTSPTSTPMVAAGGGITIGTVHVDVSGQADPVRAGRQFVEAVKAYERVAGTSWRS